MKKKLIVYNKFAVWCLPWFIHLHQRCWCIFYFRLTLEHYVLHYEYEKVSSKFSSNLVQIFSKHQNTAINALFEHSKQNNV